MTRSKHKQLLDDLVTATREPLAQYEHDRLETFSGDQLLNVAHDLLHWTDNVASALNALEAHLADIDKGRPAHNLTSTSIAAADLKVPSAGFVRRRIIDEIALSGRYGLPGLTDSELERRLHKPHQTVSSARNFLVDSGWLRDSGLVRQNPSGSDAAVWVLTEAAMTRMADPSWVERSRSMQDVEPGRVPPSSGDGQRRAGPGVAPSISPGSTQDRGSGGCSETRPPEPLQLEGV